MIRVGIFGAASLVASKLLQLLANHPEVEIGHLISETYTNERAEKVHRFLKDVLDLKLSSYNPREIARLCDIVFMCKGHGNAFYYAKELLAKGLLVIDLSADFRLSDPEEFLQWYGIEHKDPSLLPSAVYGLPEIYSAKIKEARLVANPGCYPVSIILGVAPLVAEGLVRLDNIVISSVSGASGAGRSNESQTQFIELEGNIRAYKVGIHQHTPEVEQELTKLAGQRVTILFAPHIAGYMDGIIATIFLELKIPFSAEELFFKYQEFYQGKRFVRIHGIGSYPQVKDVVGSNFCDIGLSVDKRTKRCVVTVVIDNMIKGGAGNAIQNMNLMFDLSEIEGLPYSYLLKKDTKPNESHEDL